MNLDFITDDDNWANVSVTTDGRILDHDGEEVLMSDITEAMENVTTRIEKLKRMIKAANDE